MVAFLYNSTVSAGTKIAQSAGTFWKVYVLIDGGVVALQVIEVNEVQFLKAKSLIIVIFSGIIIVYKFVQLLKTPLGRDDTPVGMSIAEIAVSLKQ